MDVEGNPAPDAALLELSTEIVAAYVGYNALSPTDLPKLIGDVYAALKGLGSDPTSAEHALREPIVPVRRSIMPDYLVCLEDGKKFKSLKRHLRTNHNLTPEQYRAQWRLPPDYPMVAPNYSAKRSSLAKSSGLGHKGAKRGRRTASS